MEMNQNINPLYTQIEREVGELFDYTLQQKNQISQIIDNHIITAEIQLKHTTTFSATKIQFIQENLNEIRITNNEMEKVLTKIYNLKSLLIFVKKGAKGSSVRSLIDKVSIDKGKLISLALGQLKLIKREYKILSNRLNELVLKLWLDRDIAAFLSLYLLNIQSIVNRFLQLSDRAEIAMADLFTITSTDDLQYTERKEHLRVVVRILKNWFKTEPELNLIQELFPDVLADV